MELKHAAAHLLKVYAKRNRILVEEKFLHF